MIILMMLETWGFWTKQIGIKNIKQNETLSGAQSFTVTGKLFCTICSTLTHLYCFKTSVSIIIYILTTAQLKSNISHLC